MKGNNWNEEELIQVLYLYCRTPLGRMNSRNPEVISLSKIINRTPGSISLKLGNFISLDPKHKANGIVGSINSSKLDKVIWERYSENLDALTDAYLKISSKKVETTLIDDLKEIDIDLSASTEKTVNIKQRLRQQFFRDTILSSYNNTCCITGISNTKIIGA